MDLKYKIVVNPISGGGNAKKLIPVVAEWLTKHQVTFDMQATEHPWHAAQITQEAIEQGYDAVIAMGGDGTANEVINGIMQAQSMGLKPLKMGIIPVGRGNDFAFSMKMPMTYEEGCEQLINPNIKTIDIGFVRGGLYPDGRYFGNGIGIGFDAVVGFQAVKYKKLGGFPSYIFGVLETLFLYFKAPQLKIKMDDETIEVNPLMVSIMNGVRMGGGFMMAPNSIANDGKFDICLVNQLSRLATLMLVPKFFSGRQHENPAVKYFHPSKIHVSTIEGTIPAHADGETLCVTGDQLEIELIPKALEIIYMEEPAA
ncbi:MAG: diacylglycerol kinase family lipid kinase [Anaerolineaceae bacterium]|nr:diacylglycerol kinase family lipid kinase [Anaerolineaceae bacterium]